MIERIAFATGLGRHYNMQLICLRSVTAHQEKVLLRVTYCKQNFAIPGRNKKTYL